MVMGQNMSKPIFFFWMNINLHTLLMFASMPGFSSIAILINYWQLTHDFRLQVHRVSLAFHRFGIVIA